MLIQKLKAEQVGYLQGGVCFQKGCPVAEGGG